MNPRDDDGNMNWGVFVKQPGGLIAEFATREEAEDYIADNDLLYTREVFGAELGGY